MKGKLIITALIAFFISCNANKESKINHHLYGKWHNAISAPYQRITFNKGGYLSFYCRADTIFDLKYRIRDSAIILHHPGEPIYKNKIICLRQDTLVLESIYKDSARQIFIRSK